MLKKNNLFNSVMSDYDRSIKWSCEGVLDYVEAKKFFDAYAEIIYQAGYSQGFKEACDEQIKNRTKIVGL